MKFREGLTGQKSRYSTWTWFFSKFFFQKFNPIKKLLSISKLLFFLFYCYFRFQLTHSIIQSSLGCLSDQGVTGDDISKPRKTFEFEILALLTSEVKTSISSLDSCCFEVTSLWKLNIVKPFLCFEIFHWLTWLHWCFTQIQNKFPEQ